MSGSSYNTQCPECDREMFCQMDWKPFDCGAGECLECGFGYWTKIERMDLKEVNDRRAEYNLKPLKKLKKKVRRIS